MRRRIAAIATLALVACSGIAEVEVYEVIGTDTAPPPWVPRGHHRDTFNLGDASLTVFPVETSERLTWIIGPLVVFPALGEEKRSIDKPLQIQLSLGLLQGTASADFPKAALSVGERTLYPSSIVRQWREKVNGPVTLAGRGPHSFLLHYDIRTTELAPFTLQLPPIQLNGRDVALEPIVFRPAKRTVTRH